MWHYVTRWPDGIFNIACTVDSIVQQECSLSPICQVMLLKAGQTRKSFFLIHNLTFLEHIRIPVFACSVSTEPSGLEHISSALDVFCAIDFMFDLMYSHLNGKGWSLPRTRTLFLRSSHSEVGRNQKSWQKVGRSV